MTPRTLLEPNGKSFETKGGMEFLEDKRKSQSRASPRRVAETGISLLERPRALGIDQWSVREQVLAASLDLHDMGTAQRMLADLKAHFPASQRVARLEGLCLEASGQSKVAQRVYDSMIKENPINMVGHKRKVAMLKAAGRLEEAISHLVKYLNDFQADAEGWKELAALYVEAGSIRNACFCLEEVLLSDPHSYLSHLALAEANYTLGGNIATMLRARRYFSTSLDAKPGPYNVRALWGIALTSKALSEGLEALKDGSQTDALAKKEPNLANELVNPNLNTAINAKARLFLKQIDLPHEMKGIVSNVLERLTCT